MKYADHTLIANQLRLANDNLASQYHEKEKRAEELIIANKELAFQNKEKDARATELIAIYKNLKKAETYQKEYIKGLEKMMYLISHRVRQPVCQIVGISNLLETPNSAEEVKKMLGYIKASASSLDVFTKDLTKLIKKLKNKSHLNQESVLVFPAKN
ncbi:hypothetical protein WG904_16010 [Pedobacter sp. Du54]|uniref:hypothetical protein n=1 Tax=Pedobacter anseongensis TaxID=3133439 RepID=UPI00309A2BA2